MRSNILLDIGDTRIVLQASTTPLGIAAAAAAARMPCPFDLLHGMLWNAVEIT